MILITTPLKYGRLWSPKVIYQNTDQKETPRLGEFGNGEWEWLSIDKEILRWLDWTRLRSSLNVKTFWSWVKPIITLLNVPSDCLHILSTFSTFDIKMVDIWLVLCWGRTSYRDFTGTNLAVVSAIYEEDMIVKTGWNKRKRWWFPQLKMLGLKDFTTSTTQISTTPDIHHTRHPPHHG